MSKIYVANAFSLNMLSYIIDGIAGAGWNIKAFIVDPPSLRVGQERGVEVVWAIGHADTSRIVAQMLGIPDPGPNRVNVQLGEEDQMYVAQYSGPRLPEGATELPGGAKIEWWHVTLSRSD